MSLVELFCHVDDFCKVFEPHYRAALKAAVCKHASAPVSCA